MHQPMIHILRASKVKVVFTNGCFDIIHPGHIHLLKESQKLGNHLIVGLNSDESIKKIKGAHRPINNQFDRAEVLRSITYVNDVFIFNEPTPIELIEIIKPDVIVKGSDYDLDDIAGKEFIESYGGYVTTIPFLKGYGTTAIINRIVINRIQSNQ